MYQKQEILPAPNIHLADCISPFKYLSQLTYFAELLEVSDIRSLIFNVSLKEKEDFFMQHNSIYNFLPNVTMALLHLTKLTIFSGC
jgi:hypothetical protein